MRREFVLTCEGIINSTYKEIQGCRSQQLVNFAQIFLLRLVVYFREITRKQIQVFIRNFAMGQAFHQSFESQGFVKFRIASRTRKFHFVFGNTNRID